MSGTKSGARKAAEKIKAKYGEDHFKILGSKGGKFRSPSKGFGGMSKEKVSAAGRKGGTMNKGPRGFSSMTKERHAEVIAMAVEARRKVRELHGGKTL